MIQYDTPISKTLYQYRYIQYIESTLKHIAKLTNWLFISRRLPVQKAATPTFRVRVEISTLVLTLAPQPLPSYWSEGVASVFHRIHRSHQNYWWPK